MLGVPSGRRGVPGVGYLNHCAVAGVANSDAKTARAAALDRPRDLMGPPSRSQRIISTIGQESIGFAIRAEPVAACFNSPCVCAHTCLAMTFFMALIRRSSR